ncbi:MAG: phosphatase PAP2/dual specificity phosphatase family protein [Polyangiaceae bacterium]
MKPKPPPLLLKRGLCWLVFLGPFFFLTYGLTNYITAARGNAGAYVYDWEKHIPFVPWLMLPYMSIDAFYAASLLMFRKRERLDRHALRLLSATLISCAGFLLFPLRFSFDVPHADGFDGWLQKILLGFDKPFNQAPSLHVSLLLILWAAYAKKTRGLAARLALHAWFTAIGASVLFVYQHHFIDVWTGALVGITCLYIIPEPPLAWRLSVTTRAMRSIGARYAVATLALVLAASLLGHRYSAWYLLMVWPTLSLGLVAAAYHGLGSSIFQRYHGRMSWPARLLLAPYLLGAWFNTRYHLRNRAELCQVHAQLWLGAYPGKATRSGIWDAVLDLTNEFPNSPLPAQHRKFLPVMDLTPPPIRTLVRACRWIDRRQGNVLVHCALGLSRSASIVVCWLAWRDGDRNLEAVVGDLAKLRPGIVLTSEHKANIAHALNELRGYA